MQVRRVSAQLTDLEGGLCEQPDRHQSGSTQHDQQGQTRIEPLLRLWVIGAQDQQAAGAHDPYRTDGADEESAKASPLLAHPDDVLDFVHQPHKHSPRSSDSSKETL